MSVEQVRAFFSKMEGDDQLLAKVGALHTKAKVNMDAAIADLVDIAAAEGFKFTAADYAKARTHKGHDPEVSGQAKPDTLGGCNSNWSCARVKTM